MKVREGKPSKACREDEERFCLCGRVLESRESKVENKGTENKDGMTKNQATEWR